MNLSLYGNWADSNDPNSFLVIKMTKCLSSGIPAEFLEVLVKKQCANETQLEEKFYNSFLSVVMLDYDLDHNNFENPGKLRRRSE